MKRVCTSCQLISKEMNLWCQQKHCPAENATEMYDNGEWFGPIQIIEPVVVLRSAIIYRARREQEIILLKIANPGCDEKLRREAKALLQLNLAGRHPQLPVLLPAHLQGRVTEYPYGFTVINGSPRYYFVFANAEGEILRSFLLKNPQPWYQHAGWITLAIADALFLLHQNKCLHLCLNPEMILLRFDAQGIPRPVLLDLGVGENRQDISRIWNASFNPPAYTAPEILNGRETIGPAADVYELGLLFYEMLAGRPAFAHHLKHDETVIQEVLADNAPPTQRSDLTTLPQIAEQAIYRKPADRQASIAALLGQLRAVLPRLNAERQKFRMNWKLFFIILGVLLALSLLALLAFSSVS